MQKLTRAGLLSPEAYAAMRPALRARLAAHKQRRRVALGEHASLLFEDRLTVQYQVQEMLRIERIFEAGAIQDELDAYNPLVPDGANLKATMLIEFPDPEERKRELARLGGVGDVQLFGMGDYSLRVWLDPNKTASRNLTASDVVSAIREQNRQVAAG